MKTKAIIEKGKDGTFSIFSPDLKTGLIGSGNTVTEAKDDFNNSLNEIIQYYKEENKPIPKELEDIEFVYKYDLASLFDFFNWINVSAFAKKTGLNRSLLSLYKSNKDVYISEKQMERIQNSFHNLGQQMKEAHLI